MVEDDSQIYNGRDPVYSALSTIRAKVVRCQIFPDTREISHILPTLVNEDFSIFYGSQPFLQSCRDRFSHHRPGFTWAKSANFIYSKYQTQYKKVLLNSNFEITSLRNFLVDFEFFFEKFDTQRLFIRPDSEQKTFSGQLITLDQLRGHELKELLKIATMDPSIIIARDQPIVSEHRFFLSENTIISACQYKSRSKFQLLAETPSSAHEIAEFVARHHWLPAPIFTADICLLANGECKLVEINPFNSSSFFLTNIEKIFLKAEELACSEYYA